MTPATIVRMRRLTIRLLFGIGILCSAGYFGTYAYYRFINPDAVIDCFSFKGGSFSGITINESTCGESIVTKISLWTGKRIADNVNGIFEPLAMLDQVITGRSISFTDAPERPVFTTLSGR